MDERQGNAAVTVLRALTAGQRWTAGLALALAFAILGFGLPENALSGSRATASAPLVGGVAAPAAVETRGAGPERSPSGVARPAVLAGGPQSPARTAGPASAASTEAASAPLATPTRAVALVTPGDDEVLDRLGADLERVAVGDSGACDRAAAAPVAIAAADLPPELRACLARRGAFVVAHDAQGYEPAPSGAPTTVVSSRQGVAASLVESARAGLLGGRVGVVASEHLRVVVEGAIRALTADGVDVVAVAYVEPGERAPLDAVLDFVVAGVDLVAYAADVDEQVAFAASLAVLRPGVEVVVADAGDAVVRADYPPAFEGARAISAVAVPPPAEREACVAAGGPADDGPGLVRLLAWCQLLDVAVVAAVEGQAALDRTSPSTITSPLGPLPGAVRYGPSRLAALRWSAGCTCWEVA